MRRWLVLLIALAWVGRAEAQTMVECREGHRHHVTYDWKNGRRVETADKNTGLPCPDYTPFYVAKSECRGGVWHVVTYDQAARPPIVLEDEPTKKACPTSGQAATGASTGTAGGRSAATGLAAVKGAPTASPLRAPIVMATPHAPSATRSGGAIAGPPAPKPFKPRWCPGVVDVGNGRLVPCAAMKSCCPGGVGGG